MSLRSILNKRFGTPIRATNMYWTADYWNRGQADECTAIVGAKSISIRREADLFLADFYGDIIGAYLIGNPASLKLASRTRESLYGLYTLEQLRELPDIVDATLIDPGISYFMDSGNAWFYGVKCGELYVYDTADDQLDNLGDFKSAFHLLLDEWAAA